MGVTFLLKTDKGEVSTRTIDSYPIQGFLDAINAGGDHTPDPELVAIAEAGGLAIEPLLYVASDEWEELNLPDAMAPEERQSITEQWKAYNIWCAACWQEIDTFASHLQAWITFLAQDAIIDTLALDEFDSSPYPEYYPGGLAQDLDALTCMVALAREKGATRVCMCAY